jgi:glycosyltransferase involved in cell wall biosynthesis
MPLVVATRLGAPVLFETYRAIPLTEPLIWSIVKRSFKKKNFIGISTHSEYSRQVMIDHGAPVDKIWAIPNGYDPSDFDSTETRDSAREKLKLDLNTDIAVYTGHIREDKGVHSLLDMAEEFSGFTMLIVGGNPQDVKSLNKVIIDRRLNNVKLTGQVSINKVPLYLAAADVLILPPSSIPLQKSTVLPMKTFTYMAAGRPILAPDLPDTAGVLNKDVNCLKVTPDNIPQAVEALKKLITDSKLADRLARQAGQDVKKYTWDGRAKRLLSCLEPVIGRH